MIDLRNITSSELPNRGFILTISLTVALVFLAVLTTVLPKEAAIILLDRGSAMFPYPFTIQNAMHLLFFWGLGELFIRWRVARHERNFAYQGYLPEDDETVLQSNDLGPIRSRVVDKFDGENGFLPYLIKLCILQFQSSRSVDQAVSVLNSSLELISHRVDLRYSMLRYIVWVIPTFGFIGTVVGIAASLKGINTNDPDLGAITGKLRVALHTNLIALILIAV